MTDDVHSSGLRLVGFAAVLALRTTRHSLLVASSRCTAVGATTRSWAAVLLRRRAKRCAPEWSRVQFQYRGSLWLWEADTCRSTWSSIFVRRDGLNDHQPGRSEDIAGTGGWPCFRHRRRATAAAAESKTTMASPPLVLPPRLPARSMLLTGEEREECKGRRQA